MLWGEIMSLEEDQLKLEERKFELDAEIRRRDMSNREKESTRGGVTAAQATVAAAVIALVSGIVGAELTGWSNLNLEAVRSKTSVNTEQLKVQGDLVLEKSKQDANAALERQKFETSIIFSAIKDASRSDAIRNLRFFVNAGFIHDDQNKIGNLVDEALPSNTLSNTSSSSRADRNPAHLHPVLRAKIGLLLQKLSQEGLDFEMLEGYRSPAAQLSFYARGRLDNAPPVSNAKPWKSVHNFGVAADLVEIREGSPYFGPDLKGYDRMHMIAKELGLGVIDGTFPDVPHVELPNLSLADLQAGKYPAGGDASWAINLSSEISDWKLLVAAIQEWGPDLLIAPPPPEVPQ